MTVKRIVVALFGIGLLTKPSFARAKEIAATLPTRLGTFVGMRTRRPVRHGKEVYQHGAAEVDQAVDCGYMHVPFDVDISIPSSRAGPTSDGPPGSERPDTCMRPSCRAMSRS